MEPWVYATGSILAASLLSGVGALLIVFYEEKLDNIKSYLVALSIGAIFGGAFIHLIPKYAEQYGLTHATGLFIALSLLGSHTLERIIHWHCHDWCNIEAYSFTLVAGDSIHNVIDGMIIAGSYFVSVPAGIATTLAVMFHKVPKEVGDFGALLHGGIDRWRAVGINVGTNVFGLLGAGAVILLADVQGFIAVLMPLAIGNFIYVAGSDLLPEIQDTGSSRELLLIATGIGLMYGVALLKPVIA
ncbi:MAG: ZIP family metal transporter [Candidatus Nanohaloarchaea archaeon]